MRTYTFVLKPEPDGNYYATVPAPRNSIEQCRERAAVAIGVHIAGLQADGEAGPEEVGTPQLLTVTVAA